MWIKRKEPTCKPATRVLAWTIACGCGAAMASAHAQTPSPLAEWQYSAGVPLQKLFNPDPANTPNWQFSFGAAATLQPRSDGSDRYRVMAGPSIDLRYRDLFFASTGEGVGANVINTDHWRTSIAIAYDLGRRAADDQQHLNGLGNINPAAEIKIATDYVVSKDFPLVLRADLRRSLGGTDGWIGDISAYMPLPGSSKKFFWFGGPTATFADSRYMNRWFGVTDAQSARSGYPRYSANAGLKSVGAGITMIWFINKHWFMTADGAIEQLVGRASHSPITQSSTNAVMDMSVNYQF